MNTLFELADSYGVVPSHRAANGDLRVASPDAILHTLRALGAPLDGHGDAGDALWETRERRALAILDPVTVLWSDGDRSVRPRLLRPERGLRLECLLESESGETREWMEEESAIPLSRELEDGYHTLTVTVGGRRTATTRLLVAPREAHDPEGRAWGVFLPLHALRTRRGWGTGDLGDLARLAEWTGELGGGAVGTLPLLASFLSTPFDPNPHAPVSRLFWNELYLDVERAPELAAPEARGALDDPELQAEIRALKREPRVDYRRAYRAKRRVLEALARAFFAGTGWRSDEFWRFLQENADVRDYASFRAACELWARPFHVWPPRLKGGTLQEGDYPENAARFHLYSQWLASRQLGALAETAGARSVELVLDLPAGVHPDGYDAWRYRELFVPDVTVGAPPDDLPPGGHDRIFRPIHPERSREEGHRYLAACVRNACRHAGVLRIEHAAGLHRQYWIPEGAPASDGVYVRYPAEELWAVLCIESRRWRTALVAGEPGEVPLEVREAFARHAVRRTYVVPLELRPGVEPRLEPVPHRSLACLGTPETPPFAAWWRYAEESTRAVFLAALAGTGHPVDAPDPAPPRERARRALVAALGALATSDAHLVLVDLEDLWLEEEPHRPSWTRKARFAFETFRELPEVVGVLRELDRTRGGAGPALPIA